MPTTHTEQPMPLVDKVFWVALTIFGALFGGGLIMLFESGHWFIALIITLAGLAGLLFLVRERWGGGVDLIAIVIRAIARKNSDWRWTSLPKPHVELPEKPTAPETLEAFKAVAAFAEGRPAGPVESEWPQTAAQRPSRWERDDYVPTLNDLAVVFTFDIKRGIVRLNFQSDRKDKNEDAFFLILYGYKLLLDMDDVPVRNLDESLWESGCRKEINPFFAASILESPRLEVDRLAESIDRELYQKHSLSKGGVYRLTDNGLGKARMLFIYLIDRA